MSKMIDFIKKTISKNFVWKLFSIIVSVLLWFVVMNINNPTEVKSFNVYLTLLNKEKLENNNFTVLNEKELEQTKVEVKVKATRPALDELSKPENRKNITATIDLQQFDVLYAKDISDPLTVIVTPKLPSNLYVYTYEIVSFTPGNVEIQLDNIVSINKDIEIEATGEAKDGYTTTLPEITPKTVQISGAKAYIDKITSVKAKVDLTDISEDISIDSKLVVYDKDNKEITGLKLSVQNVNVKVNVNKQGQIQVSAPVIRGNPKENYKVISAEWSPKYIQVIGSSEDMKKVSKIQLTPVNIEDKSEDQTFTIDVSSQLEGTGLVIRDGTPSQVTVKVKIQEEEIKEFNIPMEQLSVKGINAEYDVNLPQNISLTVKGLKQNMDNFDVNTIVGTVDLTGITEGVHQVNVNFVMPDGITQVSNSEITVTIVRQDAVNASTNITTRQIEQESVTEIETTIESTTKEIMETTSETETREQETLPQ